MGDVWTQLGIGGVFALLAIREVLNFLAKRNCKPGNPGNSAHAMKIIATEMSEIRKAQTSILGAIMRVETIIRERLPPR